MARTLDVSYAQILLHFPADTGGFYWHHRLLLARAGTAGIWVALTPDGDLEIINLLERRHKVLSRVGPLPTSRRARSTPLTPSPVRSLRITAGEP